MSIRHKEAVFVRGDTWYIRGRLLDRDGTPLPLPESALIEWALLDEQRVAVARASNADEIAITDANGGLIEIKIPPGVTATVPPGSYSDKLRATVIGDVSTMWGGPIVVDDSPFVP